MPNEKGGVSAMSLFTTMGILAVGGLAIDTGNAYMVRNKLQIASEAAALAASQALPDVAARTVGEVAGIAARVVRVSFTGELSFEINLAPRDLADLWERVLEAGSGFGITPVGSEASLKEASPSMM